LTSNCTKLWSKAENSIPKIQRNKPSSFVSKQREKRAMEIIMTLIFKDITKLLDTKASVDKCMISNYHGSQK
jgi:hypothetical protein